MTGIMLLPLVSACDGHEEALSVMPEESVVPIHWGVEGVENMQSRTLLNSSDELQVACTPAQGGESIGIWADYDITLDGTLTTQYNVFDNTELIYQYKEGGNPYSDWNYAGEDLFWITGAVYTFRAYYPQAAIRNNVVSSADATTFVVDYVTTSVQQDMLVAYNKVDTRTADLSQPVSLKFKHTLSAMKFLFKFQDGYEDEDALTACWLENAKPDGLSTIGIMVYGTMQNPESLEWSESFQPTPGSAIYKWQNSGCEFKNNATTSMVATAYTASNTTLGAEYTKNDGWLLVIPQKSDGPESVKLCFTTREGGDTVYRVGLPAVTGTDAQTGGRKEGGTDFLPGYRYTYTLAITKTNLVLTLSIAPWNELNSSFDITF
ncbi:MAG: fimbrillin family protein [Bacteroides sp.]|nr:fimbrillin family protein [Bacteroides sp.]